MAKLEVCSDSYPKGAVNTRQVMPAADATYNWFWLLKPCAVLCTMIMLQIDVIKNTKISESADHFM